MNNNSLVEKFVAIEHAMAHERGPTKLLALLEPEESQGGWDMLLSADWVQGRTLEALDFVLAKMRTVLEPPEYYPFKITLLRSNEPFVHAFQQFLDDNPQQREFSDINILGLAIKRAYVIVPWIETAEDQLQKLIKYVVVDLQRLRNEHQILAKRHKQLESIMRVALRNSKLLEMPNNLELPPPPRNLLSTGDDIKDN